MKEIEAEGAFLRNDVSGSLGGEKERQHANERLTFTLHQDAHGISCQMRGRVPRYCIIGPIHLVMLVRDRSLK